MVLFVRYSANWPSGNLLRRIAAKCNSLLLLKRKNAYWDIWRSIRCGAAKKGGAAVNALSLAIYGAWPARSGHFFHGAKNPRNRHPEGVRRYGAPYCIDAMQRCCPVDPDRLDDRLAAGLVFYAWLAAKFCLSDDDQRLDVYCGRHGGHWNCVAYRGFSVDESGHGESGEVIAHRMTPIKS